MNDNRLCPQNLVSSTGKPYSEMTRQEELVTFLLKEGHIRDVRFYPAIQPQEVTYTPPEPESDELESAS